MNKERDYSYKILGLQPGATPTEIKAAFRRLVKLYHPDRDQSQDSVIMYMEINKAYKMLLEHPFASEIDTGTVVNHNTSEWKSWTSDHTKKERQSTAGSRDSSKEATWTSKDWYNWAKKAKRTSEGWENEYFNNSDVRLSFELKNLFSIFWHSLNEVFTGVFSVYEVIMVLAIATMSCGGGSIFTTPLLYVFKSISGLYFDEEITLQPYSGLAALFYVISWIIFIYFRYYFVTSTWTFLMRAVAGFLYGVTFVILIACFYTTSGEDLFFAGLFAAVSVWILLSDHERI